RLHETRFAESGLTDNEHDLAHAFLRLFPTIADQADLGIASGQWRKHAHGCDLRLPARSRDLPWATAWLHSSGFGRHDSEHRGRVELSPKLGPRASIIFRRIQGRLAM